MRFCLNSIRKIVIRVTSSKRYQNVRSDITIFGPFANVTLTLCVSWEVTICLKIGLLILTNGDITMPNSVFMTAILKVAWIFFVKGLKFCDWVRSDLSIPDLFHRLYFYNQSCCVCAMWRP